MRRSLFFRFLAASLVVLLLNSFIFSETSVAAAFASNKSIGGGEQPNAAIFVSKQAPVMVSILHPERFQGLEKQVDLSKLKESFLGNSGIDYRQDIQPWLGSEITLAVTSLDFDRDADNGKQPGYLMALATKAPEKSREFLQLLFSKRVLAGADLNVEEYAGIKIIADYSQPEKGMLTGAVVGDKFVLFANDPKVLREAINNVQAPDLNLTSSPQYQEAAQQISQGALGVTYLNLPTVAEWQGLKLPVQTFDTQLVSLSLAAKGLLAETVAFTPEAIPTSSLKLSKPVGALQYIPPTFGMTFSSSDLSNISSSNLARYWQQLAGALSGKSEVSITNFVLPLAEAQNRWGVNLSADIFKWVTGEYAVALMSNPQQGNPDWVFVVEKTPTSPDGISRLDEIAAKNGLSVSLFTLDKQPITAWTQLAATTTKTDAKAKPSFSIAAKAYGVHTTLGNYEIFTSSLETMHEVIASKDHNFTENRNFQKSIAVFPKTNQGYIHIDWANSQDILQKQLPILQLLKVVAKPLFDNLRSLTISNYDNSERSLKGGVFFQLDNF
ncbi:hypothetical protein NIES4101_39110 [Calothrix sp. NIES-4101]|nr:hypothetical protein NIES4101_39110 [Calothrix sp. NIES-4101]